MQAAGVDAVAIDVFSHYYRQLEHGETGLIPESSIEPLDMESIDDAQVDDEAASDAIGATVVIKLNGGLGTSMGMARAKSLLCVRRGLSFLDVIARQVLHLRREYGATLPLMFMNSFRTSSDTLAALARYEDLEVPGLPLEFLQNKEPKLKADNLRPISVAEGPGPRVVSAGARRPLHRADGQRSLRQAPRRRLPLRLRLQRRQPGRRPRRARGRLVRPVRGTVRHRGRAPHPLGPQGRPLRPTQGRRPDRAARDRPDLRRRPRGAAGPRPAPVLLDQQPVVRPRADARRDHPARRHPRPADDPQREERRPRRPENPEGDPGRDGHGCGDRGLPRLPHHRGRAATGSCR